MAEVMDLDMSLDEIAKKRNTSNKRGGRPARGGRGAAADSGSGRVTSSLRHLNNRSSPYVGAHSLRQPYTRRLERSTR